MIIACFYFERLAIFFIPNGALEQALKEANGEMS